MENEVPDSIYFYCPGCGEHEVHEVLKGKLGKSSLEATIRCNECGRISPQTIRLPKMLRIPVIISEGPVSRKSFVDVEEGEKIAVGDEFFGEDDLRLRVSGIEVEGGGRPKKTKSQNIKTIWAQKFDVLSLKVTVNDGTVSYSRRIEADPGDEFFMGQKLELKDMDCVIHAIKTRERLIDRGSTEAREIIRIYGKFLAKTYPVLDFEDEV